MRAAIEELGVAERRRLIALGLARALVVAAVLVALYYWLPLDGLLHLPSPLLLALGLAMLTTVIVYQVRSILRSRFPGVRAIEALAATTPLFLLLFAATYYLLAHSGRDNFNVHDLTRTDALYFTVTTFSTVGFGDITATSPGARLMVTSQMILDLLVLGFGFRIFVGAVKLSAERDAAPDEGG